jgi:hypothetical protein
MKTLLWIGLAVLLLPALEVEQSDFDGTWRVDPAKVVFRASLKSSHFRRDVTMQSFGSSINMKADGDDHNVAGSQLWGVASVACGRKD